MAFTAFDAALMRIILTILLSVLFLSKAQGATQATFSFNITVTHIVSTVCGPPAPSPPPQAQVAGYTTLAACFDFSASKYANQTNYVDCGGGGPGTREWWQDASNVSVMPCDMTQVVDNGPNGDNSTVIKVRWKPGYGDGAHEGLPYQNQFHTLKMYPENAYLEVNMRTQDLPDVTTFPYTWIGNYTIAWNYANPGVEIDLAETISTQPCTGCAFNPGKPADTMHIYNPTGEGGGPEWSATSGFDIRQYHTYGMRHTSDGIIGAANISGCAWIDNQRSTVPPSNTATTDPNGCFTYSGQPTTEWSRRANLILDAAAFCQFTDHNFGDISCVPSGPTEFSILVKWYRLWTCSSWNSIDNDAGPGACATGQFVNP